MMPDPVAKSLLKEKSRVEQAGRVLEVCGTGGDMLIRWSRK